MRLPSIFVLLCLLPAADAAAAPPTASPRPVARAELSLAGIVLGDRYGKVRDRLGKPGEMRGKPGDHDYSLVYPGLEVTFYEEGTAVGMSSTSPRHCTPSGVCPGQTLAQAHARLGNRGAPPRPAADDDKLEYYVADESCWLQLDLDMDPQAEPPSDAQLAKLRVKQVAVVCVP